MVVAVFCRQINHLRPSEMPFFSRDNVGLHAICSMMVLRLNVITCDSLKYLLQALVHLSPLGCDRDFTDTLNLTNSSVINTKRAPYVYITCRKSHILRDIVRFEIRTIIGNIKTWRATVQGIFSSQNGETLFRFLNYTSKFHQIWPRTGRLSMAFVTKVLEITFRSGFISRCVSINQRSV